ncbi:MAG: flagellar protein, partial [Candidatus Marinimicrobia bacterium]|nr:flagellar protein [Candidatus Neomarinimicrobiota bacterium]
DKKAYIVSVKNRTVVTALTEEATLGNVFTNIDSVAIV